MLTLEIAKKLKEAGFNKPCIANHHIHKDGSSVLKYSANLHDSNYIDVIPCPSLEELLAEMPDAFYIEKDANIYRAINFNSDHYVEHSDPTEAVAQLYIKLRQEGLIK